MKSRKPLVGIIMGSDSDLPVMQEAANVCKAFGVPCEMKVLSAHRTPELTAEFASGALKRGIKVIIAGAGGSAHLPGVAAAYTTLPVIGVPILTKSLQGLDSLLSIVQMPSGIPVATVAIDGGKNAGILAVEILSLSDNSLRQKPLKYKKKLAEESIKKNLKIKNY
jgi:5-(carboxyamino)imidazole ribonucleotide mutase